MKNGFEKKLGGFGSAYIGLLDPDPP